MKDLDITPLSAIPDHSVLILDVTVSDYLVESVNTRLHLNSKGISNNIHTFSKEFNVSNITEGFMNSDSLKYELNNFRCEVSTSEVSQLSIDRLYENVIQLYRNEMKNKLPMMASKERKKSRTRQPFWNETLNSLYKEANQSKREFLRYKGDDKTVKKLKRETFKEKQSNFDKHFKKVKREFHRSKEIEIESMIEKDGVKMWKCVEKIGPGIKRKQIPMEIFVDNISITNPKLVMEKWSDDFASLYKGVPLNDPGFDNDFIRTILSQKNIITPELDTEVLNRHITKQEIKEAVDSSKNGKAVSVDKLPNEIFKNPMSICILYDLFNFCFVNALIPNLWRKLIISPIFKGKGKDPRNPLSYRPIALICNPCKFYANILNKRLLKYVELNELLVEEQNGFRKRRSCQDHVFVLKNIIDIKLKEKKSIFACFVDFSSAYDYINRELTLSCTVQICPKFRL